jgi:phosphatidylglycerophosphatase A
MKPTDPLQRTEAQVALRTFTGFFACGFGAGLSPIAPGTAGTMATIPLAWLLSGLPLPAYLLAVLIALLFGIYASSVAGNRLGNKDPGVIVWDEMVGFWIAVAFVPVHWAWWLAAFFLFRLFDIAKPWPVSWADRRLQGGLGIMLDDVIAGIYTAAALWAAGAWLGST